MNTIDLIAGNIRDSIQTKQVMLESIASQIADAANKLLACLQNGDKVLSCGHGGSAADAQHFSSELINRFGMERPSLPAIALTTDTSTLTPIANDYGYSQVFSKPICRPGQPGDILLALSTSGQSANTINAVHAAHKRDMQVICLYGKSGGEIATELTLNDLELRVTSNTTAGIQDTHYPLPVRCH